MPLHKDLIKTAEESLEDFEKGYGITKQENGFSGNPKKPEECLDYVTAEIKKDPKLRVIFHPDLLSQDQIIREFLITRKPDQTSIGEIFRSLSIYTAGLQRDIQNFPYNTDAFVILKTDVGRYIENVPKITEMANRFESEEAIFEKFQKTFRKFFLPVISGVYLGLLLNEQQKPYLDFLELLNNYLIRIDVYTKEVKKEEHFDHEIHQYVSDSFQPTESFEKDNTIYEVRQYPYFLNGKIISRALVCVWSYKA